MEGRNWLGDGVTLIKGRNKYTIVILNVVFFILVSSASLREDNIVVESAPPLQVKLEDPDNSTEKQNKSTSQPICLSESCRKISKLIQTVWDRKVDPCENFYEYACGTWIKNNKVPKNHLQFSRITQLSNHNEDLMKDALATDQPGDTDTIMKVKNFYRSCIDLERIDKMGNKPLYQFIESLGSWSLYNDWSPRKWDFYKVLAHVQKNYPVEVFFSVNVIQDPVNNKGSNERKYVILVSI